MRAVWLRQKHSASPISFIAPSRVLNCLPLR